jgi:hypothetical protein
MILNTGTILNVENCDTVLGNKRLKLKDYSLVDTIISVHLYEQMEES